MSETLSWFEMAAAATAVLAVVGPFVASLFRRAIRSEAKLDQVLGEVEGLQAEISNLHTRDHDLSKAVRELATMAGRALGRTDDGK